MKRHEGQVMQKIVDFVTFVASDGYVRGLDSWLFYLQCYINEVVITSSLHQDITRSNKVFIGCHYNVNQGFTILCNSSWFID